MTRTPTLILLSLLVTGCVVNDSLTARAESGDLEAQADLADDGLRILGLALDDPEPVRRYAEQEGMNYPVFADPAQIGPALARLGDTRGALPFTVVIDRSGTVVEQHYGELDRVALDAILAPYL